MSTRSYISDGLPVELIVAALDAAPGNEIKSGKFGSPESSAALVANAFGLFLEAPHMLPPLSGTGDLGWPPVTLRLKGEARFPWAGGRHPWLDVLIETSSSLIGVESKRYEPFRERKNSNRSQAYWRDWGPDMKPYERVRDALQQSTVQFTRLDVSQLIKHAFGLRTAARRYEPAKKAVLRG